MRRNLILNLALFVVLGHSQAVANVMVVEFLRPYVIVPGKVAVEPLVCPFAETDSRCPEQAKPRDDPSNWLTAEDHPSRASRENQSGAAVLQLEIDRKIGRPQSCKVTRSSGFELLDTESCKIISRRARFWPQITPNSASVPLSYYVRIVWLAPWVEDFR
jgi:periplasmic protein TonB